MTNSEHGPLGNGADHDARLRGLANDGETVLGYLRVSSTDRGDYYLVVRSWPHPDVPGATILSERYAYLTTGDGSDGWIDNGVNRRVEGFDPATMCQELASVYAQAAARFRGGTENDRDPHVSDLLETEG